MNDNRQFFKYIILDFETMNWLESLRVFSTVAKHKSFSESARKLKMNPAKTTKIIQDLEEKFKAVLFIRTTRHVSLTEEGKDLLKRINPFLEEWENIRNSFSHQEKNISGIIHIGIAPDILSTDPILEYMTDFLKHNPNISFNIKTYSKPLSLIDQELDLFIGTENYIIDTSSIIGRKLFNFNYGCYAAPAYIQQFGIPKKTSDLAKHNCLIYSHHNMWAFRSETLKVSGNFYADDGKTLYAAACSGLGIIRTPDFMTADFLKKKMLIPILKNTLIHPAELKLFYPKLSYQPRKIKEIIEFLLLRTQILS